MNKKLILGLSILAISMLVFTNIPRLAGAQPGDAADPLVTRRYVDARINELTAQISRLEAMISAGAALPQAPGQVPPAGQAPPPAAANIDADALLSEVLTMLEERHSDLFGRAEALAFQIYNVPAGQRIYFKQGAEFILRTGNVVAVTGAHGFIDVTEGRDVTNGETINHNHLLLVPVTDGRGLQFITGGWILIKGGYEVAD